MAQEPAVITVAGTDLSGSLFRAADELDGQGGPVVLVSDRSRLPAGAMEDLCSGRPRATTAFVTRQGEPSLRVLHHRIVDVGTSRHRAADPDAATVGLMWIGASDRARAARALRDAAALAQSWGVTGDDPFGWALLAVVREGVPVAAEDIEPWPLPEPGGAVPDLSAQDVARIRLARANRSDDGVYSKLVLRRLSKPLSALGARRGWSPNSLTLASLATGVAAAACFASGNRAAMIVGALLLQVALVIDCSDGEVARLTGRFSAVGAWLDASTDRIKEYLVYAGLAVGAAAAGTDIWLAAAATMTLQTVRHLSDYTFARVRAQRETARAARPLTETNAATDTQSALLKRSARMNNRSGLRGLKDLIYFPIGERWLVISITAAILTPSWTFAALLVLGAVALAYSTAARCARSWTWTASADGAQAIRAQVDAGPVAWLAGKAVPGTSAALLPLVSGRFGWALPSVAGGVELLAWLILVAVISPGSLAAVFWVMFMICFHRYDLMYRAMAGRVAPRWLLWSCGGGDGRVLLLAVLSLAGAAVLASSLPWVAGVLGIVGVVIASGQWLISKAADD
ncbi:MAG: CDP-alcohol phosphatidyltransferase family protein [Candidatus Nanopelagicales bacterium]|nr:DUF5941 domain-containing protein [Candidatus Nanopelagicales bacterium]MDZ4250655.1 CDP-alcohol phosphatidyltransferase family protein [Candidatus Nanopelagicales bacterium]